MKRKKTAAVVIVIIAAVVAVLLVAHLSRGFDFVGFVRKLHGG